MTNDMASSLSEEVALSQEEFGHGLLDATAALSRSARRLAANDADGEDLLQDTLIRAWAAQKQFEPGSNLKAWLFRIQKNLFLSGRRRAWRQVQWDSDTIERTLIDEPRQETALILSEAHSLIDTLPTHEIDAFRLVAMEGHSYQDVALTLGLGLNTVKSRVSRARGRLIRLLNGELAPPPPAAITTPSKPCNCYEEWRSSGMKLIG